MNLNLSEIDSPSFWNEKYEKDEARWDLKDVNPVFKDLLLHKKIIQPCKLLITGCGKGYDAIFAAQESYEVTAVDFSSFAVSFAKELAETKSAKVNFVQEDIFQLENGFSGSFDAVYEYTTFCAINPERREEYLKKICGLIKPGGKLIALLFPIDGREGGPPFNIDVQTFHKLVSSDFNLDFSFAELNSVPQRKGKEVLHIYTKKLSSIYK
jgi:methyl halide transferase